MKVEDKTLVFDIDDIGNTCTTNIELKWRISGADVIQVGLKCSPNYFRAGLTKVLLIIGKYL